MRSNENLKSSSSNRELIVQKKKATCNGGFNLEHHFRTKTLKVSRSLDMNVASSVSHNHSAPPPYSISKFIDFEFVASPHTPLLISGQTDKIINFRHINCYFTMENNHQIPNYLSSCERDHLENNGIANTQL